MPVREYPNSIENPFSDKFMSTWNLWKDYMKSAYQFEYKSVISEQMALNHAVELSDGYEDKAIKIINQSIRLQYKGFFPLRQTTSSDGKSGKKSGSKSNEAGSGSTLRDRVQAEVNKRYGSGEQSGDEPYLKAV